MISYEATITYHGQSGTHFKNPFQLQFPEFWLWLVKNCSKYLDILHDFCRRLAQNQKISPRKRFLKRVLGFIGISAINNFNVLEIAHKAKLPMAAVHS